MATKTKKASPPKSSTPIGPYAEGDAVVIRAIPFHYIGVISKFGTDTVTLAAGAVWLADSARWANFLEAGAINECEPYCDAVSIRYSVIADVTVWRHAIPVQK